MAEAGGGELAGSVPLAEAGGGELAGSVPLVTAEAVAFAGAGIPVALLTGAVALAGASAAATTVEFPGTQWSTHRLPFAVEPGGHGCAVCTAATCTVQKVLGRPVEGRVRGVAW